VNNNSAFVRGTYANLKRAWLLTWEWATRNAEESDKYIALLNGRCSDTTIKRYVQQIYVNNYLSIFEQFAFLKSKKSIPYKVQYNTIAVDEKMQKESSLPPQVPFAESMIIGGNPWIWARIVYDLETWIDLDGVVHLEWLDRENLIWKDGEIHSDMRNCHLAWLRYLQVCR
jgi:hypothetical protein